MYNVGFLTMGFMTHSVTKGIMVQRGGFDFGLYDSFGHPFVEGKTAISFPQSGNFQKPPRGG